MEEYAPDFVKRLQSLETALKTELRPGSVSLHVKPIRYIETPSGYGPEQLYKYRFQVQTVVDSSPDDTLEAVSLHLTALANDAEVIIDDITPQPGFSTIGVKSSAGVQLGKKQTISDKEVIKGELASGVGKVSTDLETISTEEHSSLLSIGAERSLARVEQYLIARKVGNRAFWRTLAGVGPVDAGGVEYTVDFLISDKVDLVNLTLEAKVEWLRNGAVTATLQRLLELPRPFRKTSLHRIELASTVRLFQTFD